MVHCACVQRHSPRLARGLSMTRRRSHPVPVLLTAAVMSAGISRSFMTEFINLYKGMPCLWNPKARDYNYRSSKTVSYNVLVEKYREVEPGASKETVQQRLSSLRNCRRKEYKKVKAALEMGEVYTPQLWYYNLMAFIDDPDIEEKPPSTDKHTVDATDFLHSFEDTNSINCTADSPAPSHDSSELQDQDTKSVSIKPSGSGKRTRDDNDDEEELFKYLKQKVNMMRREPPEPEPASPTQYQHIAFHWANKLSNLRGEQRIYAEKLINDTFYEAEFGRLGHGCRIVPFSTQNQDMLVYEMK